MEEELYHITLMHYHADAAAKLVHKNIVSRGDKMTFYAPYKSPLIERSYRTVMKLRTPCFCLHALRFLFGESYSLTVTLTYLTNTRSGELCMH